MLYENTCRQALRKRNAAQGIVCILANLRKKSDKTGLFIQKCRIFMFPHITQDLATQNRARPIRRRCLWPLDTASYASPHMRPSNAGRLRRPATHCCHPKGLRMNRKRRQTAGQEAAKRTTKGHVLRSKTWPFANPLTASVLQGLSLFHGSPLCPTFHHKELLRQNMRPLTPLRTK